jgi:vancomycin resistance protein YoaR
VLCLIADESGSIVSNPESPEAGQHARPTPGGVGGRRALLAAGAVLAGSAAFYLGMLVGTSGDIPANTTVLGVQIGGLSQAEATAVLDTELAPRADIPVTVTAYDVSMDVKPAEVGMSLDVPATVDAAAGRLYNPLAMVQRLFGPVPVDPVVVIDEATLSESLLEFASTVETEPVEPVISYEGLQPVVTPGADGQGVDLEAAVDLIADAYLTDASPVAIPEITVEPTVSQEQADEVRDGFATVAVSGPVTIKAGSVSADVTPETIARSLSFLAVDGAITHQVDGKKVYKSISEELAPIETPGNNATFQIVNGTPVVVPSQVGEGVSDDDLAKAVDSVLGATGSDRVAIAPITVRDPSLTTEGAQELGVTELVSTFTQQVSYVPYMAHNLALAAEYINGTLLLPGEEFSMNETTENRDPVDGYMEGYVIGPGGVFARALGGGISAATTTVWSAAFYAGMEPVEVRAHSVYISRYVPGLEATVAWDYFDMRFKNDTPYGVFITASTTNTSMTVSMWSTKQYTDIKAEVGERYNVTDFRTIYNTSSECAAQSGGVGFTIDVDRVFYEGSQEVRRETMTTRYAPSPKVVCGPNPADAREEEEEEREERPTPTPTPTPTPEPSPSRDGGNGGNGGNTGGDTGGGTAEGPAGDGASGASAAAVDTTSRTFVRLFTP